MIYLFQRGNVNKRDGILVIFDSGYTHTVAPVESDFVGEITPIRRQMHVLVSKATIMGEGIVF